MVRRILSHLILLLAGLCGAFLLCEAFLRAVALIPRVKHPYENARPIFYYKQKDAGSMQNFRYAVPKPPGVFRIGAIGDSFTYPHMLQFDDAYPARLARIMNFSQPQGSTRRAEVINYGMAGYSTEQEVALVERALAEGCDVVLLEITLNDPAADATITDFRARYPGTYGKLQISAEKTPLLYYSKTLGFLAERIHNWRTHESFVRYHQALWENPVLWNSFSSSVRKMQELCKARGVPFYTFTFPLFAFPLDRTYPFKAVHRKITEFMQAQQVPHLDLFKAYRYVPHERLHVTAQGNTHPNEIGHRVAAEYLYLWLEHENIIPEDLKLHDKLQQRYPTPKLFTEKNFRKLAVFRSDLGEQ